MTQARLCRHSVTVRRFGDWVWRRKGALPAGSLVMFLRSQSRERRPGGSPTDSIRTKNLGTHARLARTRTHVGGSRRSYSRLGH